MPKISVLIPTYNGAAWIGECLRRVQASAVNLDAEILLVDNASTDSTVELAQGFKDVRIIRNDKNLGFPRAVNLGAQKTTGDILILLNQDVYLNPQTLSVMLEFLSQNRTVAGGQLLYSDGRLQPSCGPTPKFLDTLWRLALPKGKRKYYLRLPGKNGSPDGSRKVDWVTGAFMAFPRKIFESLSGFDEDYFMYYEDADFCHRAWENGFEVHYLPQAQAFHMNPYSSRREIPEWLQKEVRRSQMLFFKKHRPAWEHQAIRAMNRLYSAIRGWEL